MTAVDTNVVVRLLTSDDARQAARAKAVFRADRIWLSKTVLLETEWVLRSLYKFKQEELFSALVALTSLANVRVEEAAAVFEALRWASSGMDFADALHLASRGDSAEFVTFDANFAKRAAASGASGVVLLRG